MGLLHGTVALLPGRIPNLNPIHLALVDLVDEFEAEADCGMVRPGNRIVLEGVNRGGLADILIAHQRNLEQSLDVLVVGAALDHLGHLLVARCLEVRPAVQWTKLFYAFEFGDAVEAEGVSAEKHHRIPKGLVEGVATDFAFRHEELLSRMTR